MGRAGWIGALVGLVGLLAGPPTRAWATAQRITAADTARLFGGSDAEGGVGDWYLSNGVVEAIVDDAGVASDLVGIVSPGQEPPIQSEINPTGGTLIDVGRVGADDDQLTQLFTVGGLSTSNFILYDTVSAPSADTIRATGALLLPPASVRPTPCVTIVTDYTAAGSDPFLTITTTATNDCGAPVTSLTGFLDAVAWTLRGLIPFSSGGDPTNGRGFNHPVLDFASPAAALEQPTFLAAPGTVGPADGVMDPAKGTASGEVAYGLVGVRLEIDPDGSGPTAPTVTAVDRLLGVSSTLVTALGNPLAVASLAPGGTMTYVRRLYVGARDDVRSVADEIIPALSARLGFATGRLAGDVDAADTSDVAASIVLTRLGRCGGDASRPCKAAADCAGGPACADPVPIAGFGPGGAVTHVRTDATGAFGDVVVPQGDYELVVASAERDDVTVRPVVVGAGTTTVTTPPLSARGGLAFVVREKRRGRPTIPARLTVKGVAPTVDPRFHKDLSAMLGGSDVQPETFGGTQAGTAGHAAGQGNVIYTATGSGTIQLRPGTYDVWASRGMEYGVQKRRVTVRSGTAATARFALKRVIRTHDAISADFHVHSGRSLDSSAPLRDRVASFAGEGVEVMIATDHDKHVDYAPLVAELGLGARIRSIPGVEVTGSVPNPPAFPNAIGHINGWPMAVAADEPRDGAIADEYVAPNWVFKRLRDRGAEVVQYNHPRAGVSGLTSIGIFNSIGCSRCANAIDTACTVDADCPTGADQECTCVGFQPDRLLSEAPNDVLLDTGVLGPGSPASPAGIRNVDFDVMEIANGARDGDFPAWRQVRADWFALLNQGVVRPGTGVSDSHRITVEHAGWARTFVRGAGDDPAALDVSAFDAQVKAGNMLVSAGPWIEASVRAGRARGELGQTVASADGAVRLRLAVRSPAWIPVEEVRVVANGVVVKAFDATSSPRVRPVPRDPQSQGGTTRLQATVPLTLARDTWIVVEAGAKLPDDPAAAPTPPDVLNVVQPGVVPLAFTNPIFVDVGGDGFTPPGLAVRADRAALPPGRMTGVTRAQRAEAVRRGEFFPLHTFVLPAPGARP